MPYNNTYLGNNYGIPQMQFNPYYQNQLNQMPKEQTYQQPQPSYKPTNSLQGKSVDNIEVVKAMDIPLDGSISYFPITDGSAIVTKQLQQDGTSKTIVYKPIEEKEIAKEEYITMKDFEEKMNKMNNEFDYTDELKNIKRQLKDIIEDINDINQTIKKRKD